MLCIFVDERKTKTNVDTKEENKIKMGILDIKTYQMSQ